MSESIHEDPWDDATICITRLFIYPIKSCAGLAVDRLDVDAFGGATGDRRWVVVNARSEAVWQGEFPALARVHPRLGANGLVLHAAGHPDIELPEASSLQPCRLTIWNDELKAAVAFSGHEAGNDTQAWLSQVTGADLRLVRLDNDAVARQSVNRLHVVTEESLGELDRALADIGAAPAGVLRLRPNIVLAGTGSGLAPFTEDYFSALRWTSADGPHELQLTGPCVRCIMPNVDPVTGVPGNQPLERMTAMSAERRPGGPVTFGVYGRGQPGRSLHLGESARVAWSF